MKDQNGHYYYPDPNDRSTRMYVRKSQSGQGLTDRQGQSERQGQSDFTERQGQSDFSDRQPQPCFTNQQAKSDLTERQAKYDLISQQFQQGLTGRQENSHFISQQCQQGLTGRVVRQDDDDIEFRLWRNNMPEVWEKHGWVPHQVIAAAASLYSGKSNPLLLYDLGVAKALLKNPD